MFKLTKPCKACGKGAVYWYSVCCLCGYYQHSCISAKLYNHLKIKGNTEKLYSKITNSGDK